MRVGVAGVEPFSGAKGGEPLADEGLPVLSTWGDRFEKGRRRPPGELGNIHNGHVLVARQAG
jgi:hypothetical protein